VGVLGYRPYCIFSLNQKPEEYWLKFFHGVTEEVFINTLSGKFNLRGENQSFIDFIKQMIRNDSIWSDMAFGAIPTPIGWGWRCQMVESDFEYIWIPGNIFIVCGVKRLDETEFIGLIGRLDDAIAMGATTPEWLAGCLQFTAWIVHRLDSGNLCPLEAMTPFVHDTNGERLPIINKNFVEICNLVPNES
jgi:hypothetical protein